MSDGDLNQLYNRDILDLAAGISRTEPLADPDASAWVTSPVCGSRIEVSITIKDGKITDYGQRVQACALGQAASSIVARHVIGADRDTIAAATDQVNEILETGGISQPLIWPELSLLAPIQDYRARHGAVRLPFLATLKALDDIAAAVSP